MCTGLHLHVDHVVPWSFGGETVEGKPQDAIRYVAEALRLQPGMTQARDVLQRLTGRVTPDTQR
jgi:hypothetical protein